MSQDKKSKLLPKILSILNTKKKIRFAVICMVLLILIFILVGYSILKPKSKPVITTVATLEEIIEISELSTYTSIYEGIAEVHNKDTDKIDYYVSYEATVNAGFDFKQVTVTADEENKKIIITIPEIKITDINVDAGSMNFIFENKKANKPTVSGDALKACEADVKAEAAEQTAILDLARKNAENVLKALTQPIIERSLSEWTLDIV